VDKMVQMLDSIVNKVKKFNPEFVKKPDFKRAINTFAKKHK